MMMLRGWKSSRVQSSQRMTGARVPRWSSEVSFSVLILLVLSYSTLSLLLRTTQTPRAGKTPFFAMAMATSSQHAAYQGFTAAEGSGVLFGSIRCRKITAAKVFGRAWSLRGTGVVGDWYGN